jgi:hypothetical protein
MKKTGTLVKKNERNRNYERMKYIKKNNYDWKLSEKRFDEPVG